MRGSYVSPCWPLYSISDDPSMCFGTNVADEFALVLEIKCCAKQKHLHQGSRLHSHVMKTGLLITNIYVGSALVHMYGLCGAIPKAQQVFDELPFHNVVCWTGLITGYVQHGHGKNALRCFKQMKDEGLSPNVITFASILRACGSVGAAEKGKEIHADLLNMRLLGHDTVLGNALIDMYSKCGALSMAEQSFIEHLVRDVVSWNVLIAGYCQHQHFEKALTCFEQMLGEGLFPDSATFGCILKACASTKAISKGRQIHAEVDRKGLLRNDTMLGNALVDMYVKCGALAEAQKVLDKLPFRNAVAWTSLIAGYSQQGHSDEALDCFEQMKHEGLSPDAVTFTCVLKACGSIGAAERGKEVHAEIMRGGFLEKGSDLGNAMVDMYAKCGTLEKAQEVFDMLPHRDVFSWTALIGGYCQLGYCDEVFSCFEQMRFEGICPDAVTLSYVFKSCGIAGSTEKGQMLFETLSKTYGIVPDLDHHSNMVDLFSREGQFDKAIAIIERSTPASSSSSVPSWFPLLDACCKWGNLRLGTMAFKRKMKLS